MCCEPCLLYLKTLTILLLSQTMAQRAHHFIAKQGSISLALKYDAQVIAVAGTANRHWSLPSWDKTIIPKPFTTIHIRFTSPLSNKQDINKNESVVVSEYINNNHNILNKKVHG